MLTRVSPSRCFRLMLWAMTLGVSAFATASNPTSGSVGLSGSTPTWTGTASSGGTFDPLGDDSSYTEGTNVDTFTLTVTGTPASWVGKQIKVRVGWTVPSNDYDLYIRKDTVTGPIVSHSGGSAPGTEEFAIIDPSNMGTGVYKVRTTYFTVTPGVDQYQGSMVIEDKPVNERLAYYVKGGLDFSPSFTARCPAGGRAGEPSSRCDALGNYYVAGIRGVPAGVDLWYFDLRPDSPTYDPFMRNPLYRGRPDAFTPENMFQVGADGGGDVDIAVGFGNGPNGVPTLTFTSLVAANIMVAKSDDRGVTFMKNPAGNITGGAAVDDRQWVEFYGPNTVYLLYRTFQPAVTQIQRSTDGGYTYGPATTAGQIGQVGCADVDQNDGTVYISGSTGKVAVGVPLLPGQMPLTYNVYDVASAPNGVANIFFVVKVAQDGTAYACYSDGQNVYLRHTTDKGVTWSLPVRVSDGPESATSMLPWIETGNTPGSVGVIWYGTTESSNNGNAKWNAFYAQCNDAKADTPVFRQVQVSDHYIHAGIISTGGTLGDQNRNLLDYFQIAFDPQGAAVIAYTDDHNDFDGHTFVSRQVGGSSINGGRVPTPVEGPSLPPRQPQSAPVVDFPRDVEIGLLGMTNQNDPCDILKIEYFIRAGQVPPPGGGGQPSDGEVLCAKMTVSDLSTLPQGNIWRMNFTANAPHTGLSPHGDYSFAISDLGDQFYVRAEMGANGPTYTYGTAARNADGTLTYTSRGTADYGAIDQAHGTITVGVSIKKLNLLITHGGPLKWGARIAGLRGSASGPASSATKYDSTRGGTEVILQKPKANGSR